MNLSALQADHVTGRVAVDLTDPEDVHRRHPLPGWWAQSLAAGALGAALLHVQRARTGRGSWRTAHAWLAFTAGTALDDGPGSNLHYGAPALAYVLHYANAGHPGRYAHALDILDARTARLTMGRVDAAHRRIDLGRSPALGEFDAIRGLTGLGALWLRRDPDGPHLHAILEYLVRLTQPLPTLEGRHRPGWWTHLAPNGRRSRDFPDGHVNNGLSHGVAGPLALLALAARAGHTVPGHHDALRRILDWYDACRHAETGHVWWPYWTTDQDGTAVRRRPSWCYGTPGIARAHQLAGLALDDLDRARAAEAALLLATTARDLTAQLDNPGLCHGLAGALLVLRRAAADSADPCLHDAAARLHDVTACFAARTAAAAGEFGLFEGAAGTALALDDATTAEGQEWDACLLTS